MFLAKFTQVSPLSDKFEADKNGEMPFIGSPIAGKALGTLINGTIFKREKLVTNQVYLCQNTKSEYDGQTRINTEIIAPITSPLDILKFQQELGEGVLVQPKIESELDEVPEATTVDAPVAQPTTEEVV